MSDLLVPTKQLDNLLTSDYIPAMPTFKGLETKTKIYEYNGWKIKDETTYNGDEIVRSVFTKERIINNIKTVKIKTFEAATNTMNSIAEEYDFNNNVKKIGVLQFDYDSVNKKISQTNRVEATQNIEPQEVGEHKNINDKLIQKHQVRESKIFEQGSKLNSSPPDASTLAPAETRVKKELLDSKPNKKYELIDGNRFLVTKDGPVVDNGIRVQEVRRGNSRFIADIASKYQNGNITLKTVRVREVDPDTKKHSETEKYETKYIYDSNNKLDHTFTKSDFYGPDKKQIGLREQRVKNGEIIYDAILRYHSDGSVSSLFLNNDGNYEYTNWGAGKEIGQPSLRQSWRVSKTGLPISPLNSDTINQKATPTAEYPGQLADAINSFPSKEINPAPTDKIISSQIPERLRNIVPDRRYPV
ncbi:TPA: hypothetical protein ACQ301_003986 [Yersinia enterocolitica]